MGKRGANGWSFGFGTGGGKVFWSGEGPTRRSAGVLRGSIEERFLSARADAFAGSEREEKASAHSARNDSLGGGRGEGCWRLEKTPAGGPALRVMKADRAEERDNAEARRSPRSDEIEKKLTRELLMVAEVY